MKGDKHMKLPVSIFCMIMMLLLMTHIPSPGQFFIAGGYQNGEIGGGGDETLDVVNIEDQLDKILFYPNPFHTVSRIEIVLNTSHTVSIAVYDITYRKIKTIVSRTMMGKGTRSFSWDGKNEGGGVVPPGIYLFQFIIDDRIYARKITKL
jgi:hypothetical protein